jgi:hypothetical protein
MVSRMASGEIDNRVKKIVNICQVAAFLSKWRKLLAGLIHSYYCEIGVVTGSVALNEPDLGLGKNFMRQRIHR